MPGLEDLEKSIQRLEQASANCREEARKAHEAAQACKEERKALEAAKKDILDEWDKLLEAHVVKELASIGEQADAASAKIYEKVGDQIDILINLTLGEKLTRKKNKVDLRPVLAAGLRKLIDDIIKEHG